MNYEQKYKEALERMKSWARGEHPECFSEAQKAAEFIFPELKESEDEQSKKWILEYLYDGLRRTDEQFKDQFKAAIAWLEKQGEHAEVEPKFHEGDWIVLPLGIIAHIDSLNSTDYQVTTTDGKICDFKISKQDNYRLWTIADAKDGDVLVCESGWTCIFKTLVNDENFSSYCFMDDTKWFCETGSDCHTLNKEFMKAYNGEIKPATKEQRDTLIKAMANAGYTFDFEKKELKKIEPKKLDPDKVIAWLVGNICDFEYYVKRFKQDFGL